jgi:hypothetical protein
MYCIWCGGNQIFIKRKWKHEQTRHKWQSNSYNDKEDIPQGIIHGWIQKYA